MFSHSIPLCWIIFCLLALPLDSHIKWCVCVFFSSGSFFASIFAHHVTPSWPANTMTTTNALLMATHYHRTKSIYVENMQYRKILLRLPTFIDCLRKLDRFFTFHFLPCLPNFFSSLSLHFSIRRFCRIKDGQNQTEIKLNAILFRVTACHWNTQTKHLRHSSWSIWTIYFVSCCTCVCERARVYYIVNRILTSRKSKDGVRFGKFYSTVFIYVYIVDLQWSHVENISLLLRYFFFPKQQNKK